jgi:hypothetical protein
MSTPDYNQPDFSDLRGRFKNWYRHRYQALASRSRRRRGKSSLQHYIDEAQHRNATQPPAARRVMAADSHLLLQGSSMMGFSHGSRRPSLHLTIWSS